MSTRAKSLRELAEEGVEQVYGDRPREPKIEERRRTALEVVVEAIDTDLHDPREHPSVPSHRPAGEEPPFRSKATKRTLEVNPAGMVEHPVTKQWVARGELNEYLARQRERRAQR